MTNEKIGVLLVDVPEPRLWKYTYIKEVIYYNEPAFTTNESDFCQDVKDNAYKCTQEEAKKYPQFRWVALEDL
ncbi:TPA: hypothetical protein ACGO3D_000534 [Streptococcus suis]